MIVTSIKTSQGNFNCKYVINSAGLFSDEIENLIGFDELKVHPRRGELIVFDKLARKLFNHIILPVPTKMGKGVLISPTIFGNVMLGPTAKDVEDKNDRRTTQEGLDYLIEKGKKLAPVLLKEEITTMYTGLRAASNQSDYYIVKHNDKHCISIGGIRSTGLTASMAIAEHVAGLLKEGNLLQAEITKHEPVSMPPLGEATIRPYQNEALIAQNPHYGEIICHCERVSKGELLDALDSTIRPNSISALSRRTRACLGRCQGFYCAPTVESIFSEHNKNNRKAIGNKI